MSKRFSEQIRQAIERCGVSRYRIAKETGLSQALLSRFINGHSNLSLDSLDLIADVIGLRVITTKKRKGR